jgi:hypothetical protein
MATTSTTRLRHLQHGYDIYDTATTQLRHSYDMSGHVAVVQPCRSGIENCTKYSRVSGCSVKRQKAEKRDYYCRDPGCSWAKEQRRVLTVPGLLDRAPGPCSWGGGLLRRRQKHHHHLVVECRHCAVPRLLWPDRIGGQRPVMTSHFTFLPGRGWV